MAQSPSGINIDLHVHTRRYSPCAELVDEGQIARFALQAGLSGVVITDHDVLWSRDEIERLGALNPELAIFRGVECSTAEGHAVVIGLEDLATIRKGARIASIAHIARAQGAAVILAHPYRDADPEGIAPELLDAIEVGSTSFSHAEADRSVALARRLGLPTVASSDAHALSRIGWAWTRFPRLPRDSTDLAAMIRSGAGTPVIPRPFPS